MKDGCTGIWRKFRKQPTGRVKQFIEAISEKEPAPDRNADPMGWVGHMESLKAQAEEIVTRKLILA